MRSRVAVRVRAAARGGVRRRALSSHARAPAAIRRHTADEDVVLVEGDHASLERAFGDADVRAFAALSGDDNPLHLDEGEAARSRFGRRVVHGMLTSSLFSTVFGKQLPGSIYLGQQLRFEAPAFLGDRLTARVVVRSVSARSRVVRCETTVLNESGEALVSGEATVLVPRLVDADGGTG